MSAQTAKSDFFVAGGTLPSDSPSYVKRPADDELFNLALAGEFCYVLTPRQMGKSSLMIRTAERLKERGVRTAIIDLTLIGIAPIDQWYLDFLNLLAKPLKLTADLAAWWEDHAALGYVRRFTEFLREVVLTKIDGQVVIFIDEIDTTLKLDFGDDFFASIRAMYNARAEDPEFRRLTFVLLGVASPSDLIKDYARTPFNIGHAISLEEFDHSDAKVLQAGLEETLPGQGQDIFDRVYYWTNGHPYMTQKLCKEIADRKDGFWTHKRIDGLVTQQLLSEQARKETHIKNVRDLILNHPQHRQLLMLYRKILLGRKVADDERSHIQISLKLSGLVKVDNGCLQVRNEVYRHTFDLEWVTENTATDRTPVIARASIVVALIALGLSLYIVISPHLCSPSQWCPYSDQNLRGKTIFALAGCNNGTLFAGAVDGIYRRESGATDWILERSTRGEVHGLATSPDCAFIYAAVLNEGILLREDTTWFETTPPDMARAWTVALTDNRVVAGGDFGLRYSDADQVHKWYEAPIPIKGTVVNLTRNDGRIYAAVWGDGAWWADAQGNLDEWQPVAGNLDKVKALQVIGSPINGAPLFLGLDDGFFRWNGTRWEQGPQPWGDARTFWFVTDETGAYAGQEDNGVLHSNDGGVTWEQLITGWEAPPYRIRTLLMHSDNSGQRWLYAGSSEGIWRVLIPELLITVSPTVTASSTLTRGPTTTSTATWTIAPTQTGKPTTDTTLPMSTATASRSATPLRLPTNTPPLPPPPCPTPPPP